jgi:NAD(P)-dependent dehydrogenase (short-subunit alcohol dehydrogenase family)
MPNVLITGAARGLGLELVKRYALHLPGNSLVIATSRKASLDLEEVCSNKRNVVFVEMDISSEESILQSVETVKSLIPVNGLDILVNNAGVHSWTNGGVSEM